MILRLNLYGTILYDYTILILWKGMSVALWSNYFKFYKIKDNVSYPKYSKYHL